MDQRQQVQKNLQPKTFSPLPFIFLWFENHGHGLILVIDCVSPGDRRAVFRRRPVWAQLKSVLSHGTVCPGQQELLKEAGRTPGWLPKSQSHWPWFPCFHSERRGRFRPQVSAVLALQSFRCLQGNTVVSSLMSIVGMMFLDMTPNTKAKKPKINKWLHIKIKSFCTAKETTHKMKRQPREQKEIFANHVSVKRSALKIC